jgi:hypothetical protein
MSRTIRVKVLALLVAVSSLQIAQAQQVVDLANGWGPSPLEISQTPEYCQKQFLSKHNGAVMETLFKNCPRMNHLCPGLVLLNRAMNMSIPKAERQRILRMGKGDIAYSMSQAGPACNVWNDVKAAEQKVKMLEVLLK